MGKHSYEIYFANLQGIEYLDALKTKINDYRNWCNSSGRRALWELSLGAYYGQAPDGKVSWQVTPGGEFGELVQMKVNDYASLVRHQVVLATQQRPAGIAKAINSDIKTLRDARIGTQLVEYFLSDPSHMFERDYIQALELGLLTAEAVIVQDWNTSLGSPIAADDNGEVKRGDLEQNLFPVWNAARDLGCPDAQKSPWFIFSRRQNKYELAAKYPAHEEEILSIGPTVATIRPPLIFRIGEQHTDYIETHYLVHLPTDACKKGRITLFIADEVINDGPYPYDTKNFHRISAGEIFESCFGHSADYDLLALEQVSDTIHSIILNNISTFGVGTLIGPKGGGIAQQELAKGLRYIEMDERLIDKLKPLIFPSTPKEAYEYNTVLSQKKGELSGINSILRGDPSGQLKGASGSAMALLQSQAIAANSGIQTSFYRLLSSAGTGIIEMSRQFTEEPTIVRVVGKSNSQAIKEFKYDAKTLEAVSTVVFEPVNAVLQTASGRLTIADNLLKQGMLRNPKRYIEVLTTGNLNVLLEDDVAIEEAIIEENEMLGEGKPVMAVITEMHKEHIMGHQAVIAQPNAKKDPQLVEATTEHIMHHLKLWRQASDENPALLAATGQQVLPPMPPPGGMPPGATPHPNMPPNAGHKTPGPGPQLPAGQNPLGSFDKAREPNLPKPPTDPGTGQAAVLAPGTSVQ